MIVNFITPTKISLLDISSMGDSQKRGDESKIGQFDSGLKYAIALLLRNNVTTTIFVKGEEIFHENWEEPTIEEYSFNTFIETCDITGKEKELIQIECERVPLGGAPMNPHDMREPSQRETWTVKTGFAKAMGYNWELWMALREIWSNILDEKGYCQEGNFDVVDDIGDGTVIKLEFKENDKFYEIWKNRNIYINESEPIYSISDNVDVLRNDEDYLRIYKQNILVYSDEEKRSRFAYNIKFGEIDEKRILCNISTIESQIASAIKYTNNKEFLQEIITKDFSTRDGEFLSNVYSYGTCSDLIHEVAVQVYNEYGEVNSYDWLIKSVKERKDCKIGGKIIKTVEDSLWTYSTPVVIETQPESFTEETHDTSCSFSAEIKKYYNFDLDVEIKKAKLKGSKVVADKHGKFLIIDEQFSILNDFPEFIVQYIDLTVSGNVVKNLSEYICNLLKR